jgi:hypothetical protein
MAKKIIGWILLGIGVLGIFVLLTYGGPVFPHVIGPSVLAVIGAALLWWKRRSAVK